jgi:hypothetical protein
MARMDRSQVREVFFSCFSAKRCLFKVGGITGSKFIMIRPTSTTVNVCRRELDVSHQSFSLHVSPYGESRPERVSIGKQQLLLSVIPISDVSRT